MIRMLSTLSVKTTRRSRPTAECPMISERSSCPLCVGSGKTVANGLRKAVEASSSQTPCLRRLAVAFFGSQVK